MEYRYKPTLIRNKEGVKMSQDEFVKRGEFSRLSDEVSLLNTKYIRLESRTDYIEKKLNRIDSHVVWVLRLIIGAIITAVIGLIIV